MRPSPSAPTRFTEFCVGFPKPDGKGPYKVPAPLAIVAGGFLGLIALGRGVHVSARDGDDETRRENAPLREARNIPSERRGEEYPEYRRFILRAS